MTLTLKEGDLAFVGKSIPVPAGKKIKRALALAVVRLVSFFFFSLFWLDFGFN